MTTKREQEGRAHPSARTQGESAGSGNPTRVRPADLRVIAGQMLAAQNERRLITPITSKFSGFDLDAAYAVAHLVHEARLGEGAVPAGRKIGLTNRAMWPRAGVDAPIWAYLYDRGIVRVPGEHAICNIARLVQPKIEPEIVFHFRAAPPVGADLAAILDCIDWVAHGFEIVRSHFPDWKARPADIVADAGAHAMLLLGEPQAVERLGADPITALARFSLTLSCDAEVRETGEGANVLGNPLAAVAQLMAVLAKQPQYQPLQANETVTTGTLTNPLPIHAGETWHTSFNGLALPGLSVEFVA